jgi:hypothetical protein
VKVRELIARLSAMDGEAEVVVTLTDDPNIPLVKADSVDEMLDDVNVPGVAKAVFISGSC